MGLTTIAGPPPFMLIELGSRACEIREALVEHRQPRHDIQVLGSEILHLVDIRAQIAQKQPVRLGDRCLVTAIAGIALYTSLS